MKFAAMSIGYELIKVLLNAPIPITMTPINGKVLYRFILDEEEISAVMRKTNAANVMQAIMIQI
ncbi:MAG: hypothetical protein V3V23_04855 [Dehalococcoidales bacterium]